MNFDIITGLVYKHMATEQVIVQKLAEKNTFLVFTEIEDIKKICNTLWSIEMWFDHSVNIGCSVATPEQVLMGINYIGWVEKKSCQWKAQIYSDIGKCQSHNVIFPTLVWAPR